eukprot:TRINITY_DN4378_c0_g1_i1.p1 TRINITY_DN4378_c0_g1~~TRINITY_DN4378_c0_g1_i1.p1  ORF type:complete len:167 (+),score=31.45 TRINITY_DN4378_c0_g1_i1:36-503(+)
MLTWIFLLTLFTILFLWIKTHKKNDQTKEEPEPMPFDYLSHDLVELVCNPQFYLPILSLFEQDEDFIRAVVSVHQNSGDVLRLLENMTERQVECCESENVLFRGNTPVTKIIKFVNEMYGREYLKGCVGEVVSRVVDQEICCEVNQLGDGFFVLL